MTTDPLHDVSATEHTHDEWPFRRPALYRYGFAVALVLTAFVLRYFIFGTHEFRFPFIFFVPAAMLATWYGGLVPGLLATALGLMLGDHFFLHEHEALGKVRDSERLAIGLYAVTTTLCVMVVENLHNRIRKLEHALHRARHHHHYPHEAVQPAAGPAGAQPAAVPSRNS